MNWRKAPETVTQAFDAALPDDPAVQRKKMFGYPAAFVNGNMFAGVFQDNVIVRLPAERRAQLGSEFGLKPFEPMPGRPMREYLAVPAAAVANPQDLAQWLSEGLAFVASMPVKEAKPRKRAANS